MVIRIYRHRLLRITIHTAITFRHAPGNDLKPIDADGSVLVLRPDVTLPLVKSVAREFPDPAQLLKYGYVSTVFREYYGRSSHGRDFLQSGVEILGDATPECDGEVMVIAAEFLESVGISDMRIDLGTVAYMDALFEELNLPDDTLGRLRLFMEKRKYLFLFLELVKTTAGHRQTEGSPAGAAVSLRSLRVHLEPGPHTLSE